MKRTAVISALLSLLTGCAVIGVHNGPGQFGGGIGFGKNNSLSNLTLANGDYQVGVNGLNSQCDPRVIEAAEDTIKTIEGQLDVLKTFVVKAKVANQLADGIRRYRAMKASTRPAVLEEIP